MARGETVKSGTKVREAQYGSGDQVRVGQSRGSMREGTVVRYLGEGSYSVFIPGRGVETADEALLTLRQEHGGAGGRTLEGLLEETGWRELDTEKRSLVGQRRIRWYNPKVGDFEWRAVPKSDEAALALLDGYPGAEGHVAVYREWRELGATITAALIRAGEAEKEREERQNAQASSPSCGARGPVDSR